MILKNLFALLFFFLFVKCEKVIDESNEKWNDFKIKWTYPGFKPVGFLDQPKTHYHFTRLNPKKRALSNFAFQHC